MLCLRPLHCRRMVFHPSMLGVVSAWPTKEIRKDILWGMSLWVSSFRAVVWDRMWPWKEKQWWVCCVLCRWVTLVLFICVLVFMFGVSIMLIFVEYFWLLIYRSSFCPFFFYCYSSWYFGRIIMSFDFCRIVSLGSGFMSFLEVVTIFFC